MNARDEAALALWQANHKRVPMTDDDQIRMDAILKEFFAGIREEERKAEFERQQRCVTEEMSKCVIFISDLPPHLSGAL